MRLVFASIVAACLTAAPAFAQAVDQCKTFEPADSLMQKLRCRLQVVDNERMQLVDEKSALEADLAIEQGRSERLSKQMKTLEQQLSAARQELERAKKPGASKASVLDRVVAALAAIGAK